MAAAEAVLLVAHAAFADHCCKPVAPVVALAAAEALLLVVHAAHPVAPMVVLAAADSVVLAMPQAVLHQECRSPDALLAALPAPLQRSASTCLLAHVGVLPAEELPAAPDAPVFALPAAGEALLALPAEALAVVPSVLAAGSAVHCWSPAAPVAAAGAALLALPAEALHAVPVSAVPAAGCAACWPPAAVAIAASAAAGVALLALPVASVRQALRMLLLRLVVDVDRAPARGALLPVVVRLIAEAAYAEVLLAVAWHVALQRQAAPSHMCRVGEALQRSDRQCARFPAWRHHPWDGQVLAGGAVLPRSHPKVFPLRQAGSHGW